MPSDVVRVSNVRAISDGLALMCELPDKRRIGVPTGYILAHSEVRRIGDYRTLIITQEMARSLGLLGDES